MNSSNVSVLVAPIQITKKQMIVQTKVMEKSSASGFSLERVDREDLLG